MKFTYNQYNYESGYHRIPSKIHNFSHQHYKNSAMRMTMATSSTMTSRIFRKGYRIPSKKHPGKALPGKLHSLQRIGPGKLTPGKRIPQRPHPPPCDNSNDSGLGFDQHVEHVQSQTSLASRSSMSAKLTPFEHDDEIVTDDSSDLFSCSPKSSLSLSSSPSSSSSLSSQNGGGQYNDLNGLQINNRIKRRKIVDSLVEINEDACSEDIFIQKIASSSAPPAPSKMIASGPRQVRAALKRQPAQTQNNIVTSSNGQVQLEILSQPEQQHRARYQTEGSRGAVKDRSGNGFPIVRLVGYNKPAVLQVFIGTDVGKVAPHMFYQACKVSGKNSTPCNEKKVEGTMFIEIEFKPENDMTVTCDCVGILKERNVDVEHRFPDHLAQKSKKKSTRCRMVFRTQLTNEDGSHLETLQVCSNAIICTQPPGVPEVSKKSLDSCPVEGGLELFIIGKNFLKDTFVVFKESIDSPQGSLANSWEAKVVPDKEYLQQTHLICVVPPYFNQTIHKPIKVELFVISSGKKSETHSFMYTPANSHTTQSAASTMSNSSLHSALSGAKDGNIGQWASVNGSCIEPKLEIDDAMGMMPPPPTTAIPMGVRRSSASSTMLSDQITQLKTEILDENSSHSTSDSMDHFPVVVPPTVENLVNNSVMEHPFHTVRKQSLDVMDMRNIPMIQSTNFSQQQLIQDGRETVDKFISNITANMTTPGEHTIADFVHARAVATEQHVQMNQLITNLSSPQAESPTTMERSRSNSMSTNSSTSPQSSNTGFESSISHDIILNSNTAASLMINPSTTSQTSQQQQAEQITTDIIMNSSVAPTVLCPQNDPMTLNQVAMAATSILSDIAAVQSQDHVTNNIINNIIGANVSTPQQVVSTADTAMSVMMSLTEGQSQVTQMLNNQAPVINTNTLVNMLNQQPPLGTVPPPATNAGFLNSTMPAVQMAAINSLTTQESLMVPPTHLVGQPVEPQEVSAMSAMSDQDLISYINPSAFDQV